MERNTIISGRLSSQLNLLNRSLQDCEKKETELWCDAKWWRRHWPELITVYKGTLFPSFKSPALNFPLLQNVYKKQMLVCWNFMITAYYAD